MKRPSFQFYPADWRNNAKLRRCSDGARGAWMDILCVLHDSDEYGVVRWPLADLARAAGVALKWARELAERLVLKGSDTGPVEYVHTPRHAGKDGEPVTLVSGEGPVWFSSRMVRDEWRRKVSGGETRFSGTKQPTQPPTKPRHGEDLGDGASSSTSSTASVEEERSPLRGDAKPKKNPRRSLPEDFPSEIDLAWARQHWLAKGRADLCDAMTEEVEKFRDHHSGKNTMNANWPGAWRTWAKNAMNFTKRQHSNGNGPDKKPTAADQHLAGIYSLAGDLRRQRTGSG